jgi:hypothetical protein
MDGTHIMHGEMRNSYKILIEKLQDLLMRSAGMWEANIEMNFQEKGCVSCGLDSCGSG